MNIRSKITSTPFQYGTKQSVLCTGCNMFISPTGDVWKPISQLCLACQASECNFGGMEDIVRLGTWGIYIAQIYPGRSPLQHLARTTTARHYGELNHEKTSLKIYDCSDHPIEDLRIRARLYVRHCQPKDL